MISTSPQCSSVTNRNFGWLVVCGACDRAFVFEQSIFTIGALVLFLLIIPLRVRRLLGEDPKVLATGVYRWKIAFAAIDSVLQIALLISWVIFLPHNYSVTATCLNVAAAFGLLTLVAVEHTRTVRPSTLITTYLIFTIATSIICNSALHSQSGASIISWLLSSSTATKIILLCLEQRPKERTVKLGVDYSPEEISGILGRIVFWWLIPLFRKGYESIITQENLFPLDHDLQTETTSNAVAECWEKYKNIPKYALVRTVSLLMLQPFLEMLFPRAVMIIARFSQTFLMTAVIQYLETPKNERNPNRTYGLIAATAFFFYGAAIADILFHQKCNRVFVALRGGLTCLIYQNSLSTKAGDSELSAVTIMSNDINVILANTREIFDLPAYLVETTVGLWLLWRQLGLVSLAPILLLAVCSYLQTIVGKAMSERQVAWTKAIQKRVGLTSNLLRSMKSVKMTGLVGVSAKLVQDERVQELKLGRKFSWCITWMNVVLNVPHVFSALTVFAAYAIQAKLLDKPPLSTAQAFASLALMQIIAGPSAMLLYSVSTIVSCVDTFQRIEDFLQKGRFEDHRPLLDGQNSLLEGPDSAIDFRDVVLDIKEDLQPAPLTFTAIQGSVTMISGPVGCGKSTLLKNVLGELQPKLGRISVSTSYIGYCSQTPWLQNATLRKNIIGVSSFEDAWYQKTLDICNLNQDISQLSDGDETLLGSRGVTVSGGQKHRIALARALYSRCSILILDDLFSSLDQRTQSIVASKLFSADGHVKTHNITVLFTTHSAVLARFSEYMLVFKSEGCLTFVGRTEDWIKEKSTQKNLDLPEEELTTEDKGKTEDKTMEPLNSRDEEEKIRRQIGDSTLWAYYFKTVGTLNLIIVGVLQVLAVFGANFPTIWLKFTTGSFVPPVGVFVGVFAAVSIFTFNVDWVIIALILVLIGPKSAIRLHEVLVKTTFNAPMSFFESTDTSLLINRFSHDMSLVEESLPISIWQLLTVNVLGNLALLTVGSFYMVLTAPIVAFILYRIQRFYLRTSRQMRLLDLEAESPVYQHFTETLEGLATIRAFGWQARFETEALQRIEESQKPQYLFACIQLWLAVVLDLISSTLAVILVTLALFIPTSSNPGSIGVGLITAMTINGSLQNIIQSWAQAETSLGSIARTRSYEQDTPNENLEEKIEPEPNWPYGRLRVSNLTVTYATGTSALKKIDIQVEVGKKLGICGRTGSGKSTFISVLLRLLDPTTGEIIVDGVDLGTLSRNSVRERLICLPQDPLLLPGTFEFNLNPEGKIKDAVQIEEVLKKVQMWNVVERKGGLDAELDLGSLSHGEQQLFALARAILKKQAAKGQCILVLDEATSDLDAGTEAIVQGVIQEEFKDNTVIAVAHRLETLRDFDTIVVLDKGVVSKVGPPTEVIR